MFAQIVRQGPWPFGLGFGELLIWVIAVAAAVAIVYVALNHFGIRIPDWAAKIFWIIVVAFVAIFALRLLFSF
jgi:hypothetical protein